MSVTSLLARALRRLAAGTNRQMTSARVTLTNGRCLVDIAHQASDSGQPRFVAYLSVLELDDTVVRPLVGPDGRRIKIHATSEQLVMRVAVAYLEGRFGRRLPTEAEASLATASVGRPYMAG
jgi:hypothetical protein